MGLDITAWSHIKRSEDQDEDDFTGLRIWKNQSFPNHCELEGGNYEETDQTMTHAFRAGSYSGYNVFRSVLAQCTLGVISDEVWADPDKWMSKPFYELINFSDCEGTIGTKVSAKLYHDFKENRERFERNLRQEIDFNKETEDPLSLEPEFILPGIADLDEMSIDYYIEQYENWTRAFELAKDGGVVDFH